MAQPGEQHVLACRVAPKAPKALGTRRRLDAGWTHRLSGFRACFPGSPQRAGLERFGVVTAVTGDEVGKQMALFSAMSAELAK